MRSSRVLIGLVVSLACGTARADVGYAKVLGAGVVDAATSEILQIACVDGRTIEATGEPGCRKLRAVSVGLDGTERPIGHPIWLGTGPVPGALGPAELAKILRAILGIRAESLGIRAAEIDQPLIALVADAFLARDRAYWQFRQKRLKTAEFAALRAVFAASEPGLPDDRKPRISGVRIRGIPASFLLADFWSSTKNQRAIMRGLLRKRTLNYGALPEDPTARIVVESLVLQSVQSVFAVDPSPGVPALEIEGWTAIAWRRNVPMPAGTRYRWNFAGVDEWARPGLGLWTRGPFQEFLPTISREMRQIDPLRY